MTKKIKLAEAARDLKIENQEIIDLMEKYDGTKRKNTTSLSACLLYTSPSPRD